MAEELKGSYWDRLRGLLPLRTWRPRFVETKGEKHVNK
jgi:hypothetical protein